MVAATLKVDVVVIRREFLQNFWQFCDLSAVDFQEGGFLLSEDENTVDPDSRLFDHFRGGCEKGEICYVVYRHVFGWNQSWTKDSISDLAR